MSKKICAMCNRTGKVAPLGGIKIMCAVCGGDGYVDVVVPAVKPKAAVKSKAAVKPAVELKAAPVQLELDLGVADDI